MNPSERDTTATEDEQKGPGGKVPGSDAAPSTADGKAVDGSSPSPGTAPRPDAESSESSLAEDEAVRGVGAQSDAGDAAAAKDAAAKAAPDADGDSFSDLPGGDVPDEETTGGESLAEAGDAHPVEGDLAELTKVSAQRDEYLALAQRTQADFENYRKRMAREAAGAETRGVAKLARELLPALDNLERALSAAAEDDPLLDGVRLVHGELGAALARLGIESYSPRGERFDPAEHEAIVQQPVEGADAGTVVEVYQPGYRLNGTVIRPARVVVAA